MKKRAILLFAIVAMFSVQSAKAWHNFAHGTIAYIAEQHLTPEAKEKCHYYLRHTLPFYASWMDQWRNVAKYARANSNHSGMAMADGVNYDMTSGSIPGRVMGHLVNALAELGDGKYKVIRSALTNIVMLPVQLQDFMIIVIGKTWIFLTIGRFHFKKIPWLILLRGLILIPHTTVLWKKDIPI